MARKKTPPEYGESPCGNVSKYYGLLMVSKSEADVC
jgi:hypothetical protein